MSGEFKRLKGFADIYGSLGRAFSFMENKARDIFARYGYEELRTPILESTNLFQRSIGTETDVVKKEMFTFPDRKGRLVTLRPEATAGVLRACVEEGLAQPGNVSRFYSLGPMFRYERPQKGRMRQFHQINCECLGTDSPYADAEIICMLLSFLSSLSINNIQLKVNSLGCRNCRPAYLEKLGKWLNTLEHEKLCPDCRQRAVNNPLRVLDCKVESCKAILTDAPVLLENNCTDCRRHFDKVLELLTANGIDWNIDTNLVRGLDYYQRMTFEVASRNIGAQTAIAGGGRYDGLIQTLGGPDLPGIGFACGMERLALLIGEAEKKELDFYFLALDGNLQDNAFLLSEMLRSNGFSGEMNYRETSFKSAMRQAAKSAALYCIILGSDEALNNKITIKNMKTGEQQTILQADLIKVMKEFENKK